MANEIEFIRKVFVKSGIGEMKPTEPEDFREYFAIKAANNYFTDGALATNKTYRPYSRQEDPLGYMNTYTQKHKEKMSLVRVAENDVLFFKKVMNNDKEGRRLVQNNLWRLIQLTNYKQVHVYGGVLAEHLRAW